MTKNYYPKMQFKLSKSLDIEMAIWFFQNQNVGGVNFWTDRTGDLKKKLEKTKSIKNSEGEIKKYVNEKYLQNKDTLKNKREEIEEIYKNKEKEIFLLSNKVFKKNPWPKGGYIAYLSLFDFGPRFLEEKSFQIFAFDKRKMILFSIFHEMLHFQFYDYCLKNYSETFQDLNKEEGFFWEMSEIFNAVIQDSSEFQKIQGKIKNIGYPDHKERIKIASSFWTGDIDFWIEKYLENFLISSP